MVRKNITKKTKRVLPAVLAVAMGVSLVGCGSGSGAEVNYRITESGVDLVSKNAPISSYWMPNELLDWNPSEDKDAKHNISRIPLAERVDREKLELINESQNKDTNVVAISLMNSSTSGNGTHGKNKFGTYAFSYWQYIDKLVYWGGSAGEGIIVPPSAEVTDAAHKNGVEVLGTVFFPQVEHGGKQEWINEFLQKDENGNFKMVDKLIEVANFYKFDGWFINQETQGTEEQPLDIKYVELMQEFIKEFKKKSENKLEIMWYDSMTTEGEIDWQNALNEKNDYFLVDGDKESVADSMFLNFWWTTNKLAEQQLLKSSNEHANKLGFDPYELYAGIDIQANGTNTPIRWDLFENGNGGTHTSLGLYCPSWTYSSAESIDDFHSKENRLWVNEFGNPAIKTEVEGTEWRGVSNYVVERSVVNKLPFTTNFNLGHGYNYFIEGEQVSELDWSNRSISDIMPSYRWIIENEGENSLTASIDYSQAYNGGSSIKLMGAMEADKYSTIKLYSADLELSKGVTFTTTAKSDKEAVLDLVLEFHDGTTEVVEGNKKIGTDWTTVTYKVNSFKGKAIKSISYKIKAAESGKNTLNLGNITIDDKEDTKEQNVSDLKVEDVLFEEDDTVAGVRLTWNEPSEDVIHHEVYRVNDDKTKSFLGATPNNGFFVNALQRDEKSSVTTFEVVAVNNEYERGKSTKVTIEWPDNSVPKANFTSSKTLIAPGEEIEFKNMSNTVTTKYEWTFEGANVDTSTEENPKVSYDKEGVYSVTLKAINDKGEDVITKKELIVVSNDVSSLFGNVSIGKNVEASSFVNGNEAPKFGIDGDKSTKWCAVGPDKHNITIDLGEVKTISEVHMSHAEAGGENADMNTEEYIIEVSEDGENFTEAVKVIKNSQAETIDAFKPVSARYVRITALKATQGSDSAVRIYEIGVYGLK